MSSSPRLCVTWQSAQKAKKGEDVDVDADADDERIGEEDSHFMKLAKKLTAKTLQRKGWCGPRPPREKRLPPTNTK